MSVRALLDGRPLFSTGRRTYDGTDVILAAIVRGDWRTLERRVRLGLGCAFLYAEDDESLAAADLERVASDFRYDRNLLTVQELEAWLADTELSFDEWAAYIERVVLRERFDVRPIELSRVEQADVNAVIRAEAICSGDLARFSRAFAGRARLYDEHSDASDLVRQPDALTVDAAWQACDAVFGASAIEPIGGDVWRTRISVHVSIEQWSKAFVRRRWPPAAFDAEIERRMLEWTRVSWQRVSLPRESAAREAVLCLREDADPIEDVARRARVLVHDETFFFEAAEPTVQSAILAASPGDVIGPLAGVDGFTVATLVAKAAPAPGDIELQRLAHERLTARTLGSAASAVRWHRALFEPTSESE